MTISPLVAVASTVWWTASGRFNAETVVLAAGMAVASGLAITGGYHRLFAHRSYDPAWL